MEIYSSPLYKLVIWNERIILREIKSVRDLKSTERFPDGNRPWKLAWRKTNQFNNLSAAADYLKANDPTYNEYKHELIDIIYGDDPCRQSWQQTP